MSTLYWLMSILGSEESAQELIEGGVDLRASDNGGNAALHIATFVPQTGCLRMLLISEVDLEQAVCTQPVL